MSKLDRHTVESYVAGWHGIRLSEVLVQAIAAEAEIYESLTRGASADLSFDDEPSDFVRALADWRGKAR